MPNPKFDLILDVIVAILVVAMIYLFFLKPNPVEGATYTTGVTASVRCNNDNFQYSQRCLAVPSMDTLRVSEHGYTGSLVSGVQFKQLTIVPGLQVMQVEDAFWYIDQYGVFYAADQFTAFSKYLTRKYGR